MKTLIDFGLSIHLPNIFYHDYLTKFFCENDLIYRICNSINANPNIDFIDNNGYPKYIISNLNNNQINNMINMINCNCKYRSYDKDYILKLEVIDECTISLTLRDYDI